MSAFPRLATGVEASRKRFTPIFICSILLSAVAGAVLAPVVAYAIAIVGAHLSFPRIFDRVFMITAAAIIIICARPIALWNLLNRGFRNPRERLTALFAGLGVSSAIIIVLLALTVWIAQRPWIVGALASRALVYLPAALLIGVIEEGFFRAVLLGGLRRDFGMRVALIVSSVIYAIAHLVRAPQHYYLTEFHPAAGFENLAASLARIAHPDGLLAMLFGLFLLGLLLGEAFLLTGRVYFSIGLHAGFVLGAKCWPVFAGARPHAIPSWLAGPGPVPLIAAPAAWVASLVLIGLMLVWWKRPADE
jgi:membrane protease YdiL (CAAX protease family)